MWAGSQRPTPKPMGHFDPLVPQTIIGWKPPDEIKCSKRTLDHKGAKGHFDTLDAALQVVILTTWKCEIKGSFWTFDFRMDTACPPYLDHLSKRSWPYKFATARESSFTVLTEEKRHFSVSDTSKRIPHHKGIFYWKISIFPRSWPRLFERKTPCFKNKPKLGGLYDYK